MLPRTFLILGLSSILNSSPALAQVAPLPLPPPPAETSTRAAPLPLPPPPSATEPARLPAPAQASTQQPATTELLPQITLPASQASMLDGLYMPGIIESFLNKKGQDLPDYRDVRRLIFSIYAGLATSCTPHDDAASLTAIRYVERELGQGRSSAEAGLLAKLPFLETRPGADAQSSGSSSNAESPYVPEGVTDGATIGGKLGCKSLGYLSFVGAIEQLMQSRVGSNPRGADSVVFATLMSPGFRAQIGIEDPAITLRARRIEKATTDAKALCVARYDSATFCGCLFGRLSSSDLSEPDWEAMSTKFTAIVSVAITRPAVAESIRSCNRGS
jgi:hypothetical protein